MHGRLLAAGVPGGSSGITSYDAMCLALADLEASYSATGMTYNPEGRKELMKELTLERAAPVAPAAGLTPASMVPVRSLDPEADLAALREHMRPKGPPTVTE